MLKWFFKIALVLLGLLLLLAVAAMVFPQPFLCVDSGPVKADVIVILGGGSHERPVRAAELFKEHAAPRIIVSGRGDCEINRGLLLAAGVPANAIELENQSRTTRKMRSSPSNCFVKKSWGASSSSPRGIIRAGRWRVSGITHRS